MNYENEDLYTKLKKLDCQILRTGFDSVELDYYICKCDNNEENPICSVCAENCHKNHKKVLKNKGKFLCSCGIKSHVIDEKNKKNEEIISKNCFFAEITKDHFSYFNYKNSRLCIYCNEFCIENENNEETTSKECECQIHKDRQSIYNQLNILSFSNRIKGFNLLVFTNLLFNNEKYFNLLYDDFISTHQSLTKKFSEPDFILLPSYASGNFFEAIENFYNLVKNAKYLNYFTDKLSEFFNSNFVYNLLNCKFNSYSSRIWILKNRVVVIFRRIYVQKLLNFCPKFRFSDYENMNPLQRLMIISNVHDNLNIVNTFNNDRIVNNILISYVFYHTY